MSMHWQWTPSDLHLLSQLMQAERCYCPWSSSRMHWAVTLQRANLSHFLILATMQVRSRHGLMRTWWIGGSTLSLSHGQTGVIPILILDAYSMSTWSNSIAWHFSNPYSCGLHIFVSAHDVGTNKVHQVQNVRDVGGLDAVGRGYCKWCHKGAFKTISRTTGILTRKRAMNG